VVADGRTRYDQWRLARISAREAGTQASLQVATVREWSEDAGRVQPAGAEGLASAVEVVNVVGSELSRQSGGPRFGALVHEVLALVPLDAGPDEVARLARMQARLLGLSSDDADAASLAVRQVLAHDVMGRARAAAARGECRRETPVTLTVEGGTLVEGVVDLAFREADRWVVVDFKTDRELSQAGEDRYRRQVALYAAAITRATSSSAVGYLVRI
jgi:ATP-dependent helicase/nuclease subunit A